ncbi:MAG TPA: BsuPI-related putative proteinase inhibitor [Longimicrobium sp.]|nr:BsuPI-related putative proteinase inhibitor [Longimicrobium sp.]
MTRTLRLVAAGAVPAALLLAGCGGDGGDGSGLPLRLTVQPADSVAPGDSLRMTAYLVNPGARAVRLQFEDQCQVEFYVQAPDKSVLHPPGGGTACVGAPTVLELPPRDSIRFEDAWLVTSSYVEAHSAYAVLWDYHAGEGEGELQAGHRSNIVEFRVAHPPR